MGLKPGYKLSEVGVIPKDWEVVSAGEIGRFRGGNGFPPEVARSDEWPLSLLQGLGYEQWNNEGNETFMTNANNHISEATRRHLGATAFPSDSIVFAKVGAAIFLERKKILVQPSCIDNNMSALVLDSRRADYRFIHTLLTTTKLSSLVATTALPSLNGRQLSAIRFRLPPLPEQRAIAGPPGDVDVLLSGLTRLIAKKRDLKRAAMQQLLTGHTRLPGFSGEWKVKRLGNVITLIPGGIYGEEESRDVLIPCRVATTAHIDEDDTWNSKEMGVRYFSHEQITRYSPIEGDLIVVKSSGSAARIQSGKIGFVEREIVGQFLFSNFLMLLRPRSVAPRFLYFYLCSYNVKKLLPTLVEASTYPNIRIDDYLNVEIPSPPDDEQTAIAAVLSDMDELLTGRTRLV